MIDSGDTSDPDWSLRELDRIDAVCDEFEREWNDGQAPRIEDVLDNHPDLPRSRLLLELVHPYLVKTLEIEELGDQLIVILELIDGSNLAEWHIQSGSSASQVAELVAVIGETLAYRSSLAV